MVRCLVCNQKSEYLVNLHTETVHTHSAHFSCIFERIVSSSSLNCPACDSPLSIDILKQMIGDVMNQNDSKIRSFAVNLAISGNLTMIKQLDSILLFQEAWKINLRVIMLEAAIQRSQSEVAAYILSRCSLSRKLTSSLVKAAIWNGSFSCVKLFFSQLFADETDAIEFYDMIVSEIVDNNHPELLRKVADELDARGIRSKISPSYESVTDAIEMKHRAMLRVLEEKFGFFKFPDESELLISSARYGHIDNLERWIRKTGFSDYACMEAMVAALSSCEFESVKVLAKSGYLKEIPLGALENIVVQAHGLDIVKYLFDAGLLKEPAATEDSSADHLLELAAEAGQLEIVSFLYDTLGAKLTSQNSLINATQRDRVDIVKFCLQNQENLQATSIESAFYWAAFNGSCMLVKAFLQDSPTPFLLPRRKEQVHDLLWEVASNGHSEVVKLLMSEFKLLDIVISEEMEGAVMWRTRNLKLMYWKDT